MTRLGGDDFYVGYVPVAPAGLRRAVRIRVVTGLLLAGVIVAGLAVAQRHFAPARFEYGMPRTIVGIVQERPYPVVRVPTLTGPDSGRWVSYLLTAAGKHGAGPEVRGWDGRWTKLEGALASRRKDLLLEVERATAAPAPPGMPGLQLAPKEMGTETFVGEIVDGKCYLGVMNPGAGVTHRGCATLCLRGGTPPLFEVTRSAGVTQTMLLVDDRGRPLTDRLAGWIGSPVRVRGRLTLDGDLLFLWADPVTYERVER